MAFAHGPGPVAPISQSSLIEPDVQSRPMENTPAVSGSSDLTSTEDAANISRSEPLPIGSDNVPSTEVDPTSQAQTVPTIVTSHEHEAADDRPERLLATDHSENQPDAANTLSTETSQDRQSSAIEADQGAPTLTGPPKNNTASGQGLGPATGSPVTQPPPPVTSGLSTKKTQSSTQPSKIKEQPTKAGGGTRGTNKKKKSPSLWQRLTSCCRTDDVQEGPSSRQLQSKNEKAAAVGASNKEASYRKSPAKSSEKDLPEVGKGSVASNEMTSTPQPISRSNKASPDSTQDLSAALSAGVPITPSRSGRSTPSGLGTPGGGGTGTPLPPDETGDVMSGSVVNPGAEGSMIAGLGAKATGNEIDRSHQQSNLLGDIDEYMKHRKCLVLDLDETLVHSSFKVMHQADFVVPVEIEQQVHNVYVIKRPGVDAFMKKMGEIYEVVVFTASLSKYADPVLDILDIHGVVKHRLFRESCFNHKGNYVKDLAMLGRSLNSMIIIDNSPASYIFHPNNAVPISSWFNDPHDTELTDLTPFLEDLSVVDDVRAVLEIGL